LFFGGDKNRRPIFIGDCARRGSGRRVTTHAVAHCKSSAIDIKLEYEGVIKFSISVHFALLKNFPGGNTPVTAGPFALVDHKTEIVPIMFQGSIITGVLHESHCCLRIIISPIKIESRRTFIKTYFLRIND